MSFIVVIPARYASTRLPGKLLLEIEDKSVLQYVWEKAIKSGADKVIIAADDQQIETLALDFGAKVCMTKTTHQSGSERLAEVVEKENFDAQSIIVNLQGDEPLMPPAYIKEVADNLARNPQASVATLACKIKSKAELLNANVAKVVLNYKQEALYFSRAAIPALKNLDYEQIKDFSNWLRHIGIYAYRASFLSEYTKLGASKMEGLESLEQLRVLYHGYAISVAEVGKMPGPGIDNQADFDHVSKIISQNQDTIIV